MFHKLFEVSLHRPPLLRGSTLDGDMKAILEVVTPALPETKIDFDGNVIEITQRP